jgi:hypothetical protein
MARITRTVTVEEEGTFAVLANDAVVADGCENEYEASMVALLLSGTPMHRDHVMTIGFIANDNDGDPEESWQADRLWINGSEFVQSDDADLYGALSWTSRAAIEKSDREAGQRPHPDIWAGHNPQVEQRVHNYVRQVAAKHDLTERLPDQFDTPLPPGGVEEISDRYHVGLLLDIVRGNPHNLDQSERKAMTELVARLAENAGIYPDD